jgi:hypothetical protein
MTWLEFEEGKVKRLVIDGFIPNFEYLKNYLYELRRRSYSVRKCHKTGKRIKIPYSGNPDVEQIDYWGTYYRNLRKETISEDLQLRTFITAVSEHRLLYCLHYLEWRATHKGLNYDKQSYRRMICSMPSTYLGIGNGERLTTPRRSNITLLRKKRPDLYELLRQEYEYDKQQGKRGYLQNVIFVKSRGEPPLCEGLERLCVHNWIEKLQFRVKREEEYKDFDAFKHAWKEFAGILWNYYFS